jgi:hypothetical protein
MSEELYIARVEKAYGMVPEPGGWEAFLDDFRRLSEANFTRYVAWSNAADVTIFGAAFRTTPTEGERH